MLRLRDEVATLRAELAAEQEKSLDWFIAFQKLKDAVAATLDENRHLADGDQCTLRVLRDAYEECRADETPVVRPEPSGAADDPPSERLPLTAIFDLLLEENIYEIKDLVADGHAVSITVIPREGNRSSFLMWKPVGEDEAPEISITEYLPDNDPPDNLRKVWLDGDPVPMLRNFI